MTGQSGVKKVPKLKLFVPVTFAVVLRCLLTVTEVEVNWKLESVPAGTHLGVEYS